MDQRTSQHGQWPDLFELQPASIARAVCDDYAPRERRQLLANISEQIFMAANDGHTVASRCVNRALWCDELESVLTGAGYAVRVSDEENHPDVVRCTPTRLVISIEW